MLNPPSRAACNVIELFGSFFSSLSKSVFKECLIRNSEKKSAGVVDVVVVVVSDSPFDSKPKSNSNPDFRFQAFPSQLCLLWHSLLILILLPFACRLDGRLIVVHNK